MAKSNLENLIAWQLANAFKKEAYGLAARVPADKAFADHVRKTAASVEMNVIEGFYRNADRDFARFLAIARASLGEAEGHLRDGVDRGHFQEAELERATELARRAVTAIMRLRRAVLDRAERS